MLGRRQPLHFFFFCIRGVSSFTITTGSGSTPPTRMTRAMFFKKGNRENSICGTATALSLPFSSSLSLSSSSSTSRCFSSSSVDNNDKDTTTTTTTTSSSSPSPSQLLQQQRQQEKQEEEERITTLHKILSTKYNINATHLSSSSHPIYTSTNGYDASFGKSAIKTYQSYLKSSSSGKKENVQVAAMRTATQIDFLIKRYKSAQAAYIRHLDDDDDATQRHYFPIMIVLDNVRSAFNVGSIFRTADATGVSCVITTGITPHPGGNGSDKVSKVALGAELVVPSVHFESTRMVVDCLRRGVGGGEGGGRGKEEEEEEDTKWTCVGMETTEYSLDYASVVYPGELVSTKPPSSTTSSAAQQQQDSSFVKLQLPPKKPPSKKGGTVLFLGNEVSGVDTEILPLLDYIVEIPMYGRKNSLNVAACAPVVLYEILRQWNVELKQKEEEDGVDEAEVVEEDKN